MFQSNYDVTFTRALSRILTTIFYVTNYTTKSNSNVRQYTTTLLKTKKTFKEDAKNVAKNDKYVPILLAKFVIKAYNQFTYSVEVRGLAIARFLLGYLTFYSSIS